MDALTANMPLLVFIAVGAIAIASAILVVAMRNPVHSALFLLATFLSVAVLFVMKGAEFVGAVQVLVYAGGVMVLFLFVVMLINVKQLPTEKVLASVWKGGVAVGLALFVVLTMAFRAGTVHPRVDKPEALVSVPGGAVVGNSEAVGSELYTDYLVPFEVASLFLLVAMIGAIVIGKRELSSSEEETQPAYITDRVEAEHNVKEALGA